MVVQSLCGSGLVEAMLALRQRWGASSKPVDAGWIPGMILDAVLSQSVSAAIGTDVPLTSKCAQDRCDPFSFSRTGATDDERIGFLADRNASLVCAGITDAEDRYWNELVRAEQLTDNEGKCPEG